LGCEVDHSSTSSIEVTNVWIYTSIPPEFRALYLKTQAKLCTVTVQPSPGNCTPVMSSSRNGFLGDRFLRCHYVWDPVWDPVCDQACAIIICNLHLSPVPVVPQLGRVFVDQVQMQRLHAGRAYLGKVSIIVL
jgi:hypothetical protein